MKLIKDFEIEDFLDRHELIGGGARLLNAGSSETRYGGNCLNVDVQKKPNVDLVCDLHDLPDDLGPFDAVICTAVLQYCRDPRRVADRFMTVLKPGGLLYIDAPWVQPYCPDTPDRLRFSEAALRDVFRDFEILESGPSIRPGSALYMQAAFMAQNATRNKFANYALSRVVSLLLSPLRYIRTVNPDHTAGAFYLIGRKPV